MVKAIGNTWDDPKKTSQRRGLEGCIDYIQVERMQRAFLIGERRSRDKVDSTVKATEYQEIGGWERRLGHRQAVDLGGSAQKPRYYIGQGLPGLSSLQPLIGWLGLPETLSQEGF